MKNLFMEEAIKEAKLAYLQKEVPVGAIIVKDNKIIARAHNMKETLMDCTAHAEIIAIRKASLALKNWRLSECSMYVTLEPCSMCASAIVQCRIKKLYIGTFDPNLGACGSVLNIVQNDSLNSMIEVNWMYNKECSNILTNFFNERRM